MSTFQVILWGFGPGLTIGFALGIVWGIRYCIGYWEKHGTLEKVR